MSTLNHFNLACQLKLVSQKGWLEEIRLANHFAKSDGLQSLGEVCCNCGLDQGIGNTGGLETTTNLLQTVAYSQCVAELKRKTLPSVVLWTFR